MTDIKTLIKNLHPLEIKVLLRYGQDDELTSERLQKDLNYKEGHANQAFSWLSGKNLLKEVSRTPHVYYELTDFGRAVADKGMAEPRIVAYLKDNGAKTMQEIASALGLENKDVGSAFGNLKKEGVLSMGEGGKASYTGAPLPERLTIADSLIKRAVEKNSPLEATELSDREKEVMAGLTKKRGISETPFKTIERETVVSKLVGEFARVAAELKAAGISGNEYGEVTPDLLASGNWRREYRCSCPRGRTRHSGYRRMPSPGSVRRGRNCRCPHNRRSS